MEINKNNSNQLVDLNETSYIKIIADNLADFVQYQATKIALVSVLTNLLLVIVLTRKKMRNNPTNIVISASAISDLLSLFTAWPEKFYMITFGFDGRFNGLLRCSRISLWLTNLSEIFHTASIWLTVLLAAQRYICIRNLSSSDRQR